MRLFGFNISRTEKALTPITENTGGWYRIFESFPGAFQQNVEIDYNAVLSFHAVFACITLIASDIAKMRLKLVEKDSDGIWTETTSSSFSPVLRKPNTFQNRIQFWENWITSKLTKGNTYALKIRDNRNIVTKLIVLDTLRVTPMVSDSGDVFYELRPDNLATLGIPRGSTVIVPAREIIHDRFNCLFHPLVGLSPLYASGLAATQGLAIQTDSAIFFGNKSRPSGILIAPKRINPTNAEEIKTAWNTNFGGTNKGKIAVLGEDMKYQAIAVNAEDSQLIEQLKMSAELVCSAFHVPGYKVGVGQMPAYNNIEALNVQYYSQCLQVLIEQAELCMDEGLALPENLGTEFDLDGLLRMDSVTQMDMLDKGVKASIIAPNEARAKLDKRPVKGGEQPLSQQQYFTLDQIGSQKIPEKAQSSPTPPPSNEEAENDNKDIKIEVGRMSTTVWKGFHPNAPV